MKATDLDILLQEGEGAMLEYKESLASSIARELVVFANTAGGRILIGVRDDGTVKGFPDTNEKRARIQDMARNCDPPVRILLERIGEVTVVTVRESDAKPVQCSDGFFWRQGAVTQKLSREEIRDLFQQAGAIRFDLSICPRFRYPEDFDPDRFNDWLQKNRISSGGPVDDILVNIEAAERSGGKLIFRNAGVLFFAREPRRYFSQAYVTCLLFKGTVKVHVLDRKDFDGGIVGDIEDSLRFVERNTRTAYRIEKLQREDVPEYPTDALREAITNAVMHRDWFVDGANVFVEIFTDRIEVSSPGGLAKGMFMKDLGHKSVRRNPLIADLLHRIAFIEKAGTGIKRMRDGARDQGYPEPEFAADGFFSAIFRPISSMMAHNQVRDRGHYRVHDRVHDGVHDEAEVHDGVHDRVHDGVHDGVQERLTALELRVLTGCGDEPQSTPGLVQALGRTARARSFRATLSHLLASSLLEMTVPDKPRSKNQRYRITPAGLAVLERSGRDARP